MLQVFFLTYFYAIVAMEHADWWIGILVGYSVSALVLYLVYRHLGK